MTSQSPNFSSSHAILRGEDFKHHVDYFNGMESEGVVNAIPNSAAWGWMQNNIPLFQCPDAWFERIYYYRWWTFRKHIVQTPSGFVMTEFITPVEHAGVFNTISCALGHHLREGRWLRDQTFLDEYVRFWFRDDAANPQPHLHNFSGWVAAAAFDRALVSGERKLLIDLLPDFVADYEKWEAERQLPSGLFWQYDVADGMEESISGSRTHKNARPTISSYMFGNAMAIASIANLAGHAQWATQFDRKAQKLKELEEDLLWDAKAAFFKVRFEDGSLSVAREQLGLIPWYFNLPTDQPAFGSAWAQLNDKQGFASAWGITTAERRYPEFLNGTTDECEWDGAVWPFATSQTLTALGNLLNNYRRHEMTPRIYFDAIVTYAKSHQKNGKPYLGEFLHPDTGYWIKGDNPRSSYYNHSTFVDLVINDLIGLRPRSDGVIEVNPLVPPDAWDWFCLDSIPYHGKMLSIVWDKDGSRYRKGAGLSVFADGRLIGQSEKIQRITANPREA